ncbi:MAG: rRNA maturation RNase YbeY [Nitrospirota bacterium]
MIKVYIKNRQRSKRLNRQRIRRDLSKALRLLRFQKAEVSVLFINSRRMKLLNAQYRGINKATDVLSFPQETAEFFKGKEPKTVPELPGIRNSQEIPLGDIVICIPRALNQAKDYGIPFYEELLRLLIHGLLHLLGYDHELNTYQKQKMEKKERELLNALKTMV